LDRTANSAISRPVPITAPSIPTNWDVRTFLISPPMPIDWIAPSSGSSGQTRNLNVSPQSMPECGA
jgi:hypothetical protein